MLGGVILSLEEVLLSIDFSLERIADNLEELARQKSDSDLLLIPKTVSHLEPNGSKTTPERRGRPHGLIPHCTRCRAPHRMRHPKRNNRCIECEFEEEWDE